MEKRVKQTKGKPYKIVVCGPESSGKSTLTKLLASNFDSEYANEYLRGFAEELYSRGGKLEYDDNLKIAKGQIQSESIAKESKKSDLYFCDTDLLQTIVYSEIYYSKVQPELIDYFKNNIGDFYLLLKPDIEWEFDPVRDNDIDRTEVYNMLKYYLEEFNISYEEIAGLGAERLENARFAVRNFIDN